MLAVSTTTIGRAAQMLALLAIIGLSSVSARGDSLADSEREAAILEQAHALRGRAGIAQLIGNLKEAESLHRRAIELVKNNYGPHHRDLPLLLGSLASFYKSQGRLGEAEQLNNEAIAGDLRGGRIPAFLPMRLDNAEIMLSEGRLDEAEVAFKDALAIEASDRDYGNRSRKGLASIHFMRKNWAAAADLWEAVINDSVAIQQETKRYQSQLPAASESVSMIGNVDAFYGYVEAAFRLSNQQPSSRLLLASKAFEKAQWVLDSRASQSIRQMVARASAMGGTASSNNFRTRQDLVARWRTLKEQRDVAVRGGTWSSNSSQSTTIVAEMNAIDDQLIELDRLLATDRPEYLRIAAPSSVEIESLQKVLHADETLVLPLFVPANGSEPALVYVWSVRNDGLSWNRIEDIGETVEQTIAALRCGLDTSSWKADRGFGCSAFGLRYTDDDLLDHRPLPFDTQRASRLFDRLFGPLSNDLLGRDIILVPSGALSSLPLQVLVTQRPRATDGASDVAWLVKSSPVSVVPSVSAFLALRMAANPSRANRTMAGFGNPLLDGKSDDPNSTRLAREAKNSETCATVGQFHVATSVEAAERLQARSPVLDAATLRRQPPLPETADELCKIAGNLKADPADVWLGARATEHIVKHLSRIGELERYRILYFATHAALADQVSGATDAGLILTPPPTASEEDDGFLSASEIATLRLDADWIVLSACNTAGGLKHGEEPLSGLAQAFLYAQARALLVSHWAVDSKATVQLMTSTFARMSEDPKIGRARALQQAMIEMAKSSEYLNRPEIWAPFVFVGDSFEQLARR
ncbi:CHAT domain-containing tetratricopeptide repeat protein [Rhodopseudomonas sp. G2_2311]|uniref:CHAT domain-containing protein n=1 Tax=Rhodopseudomonas sp. G2_2311 TaxID=3114287 RepID=UPI0039C71D06